MIFGFNDIEFPVAPSASPAEGDWNPEYDDGDDFATCKVNYAAILQLFPHRNAAEPRIVNYAAGQGTTADPADFHIFLSAMNLPEPYLF
jgi:hypothetical protein